MYSSSVEIDLKSIHPAKKGANESERCRCRLWQVFHQTVKTSAPGAAGAADAAEIQTAQVGIRGLGREGDLVPIHMKIDRQAFIIGYEKPMGSTLGAQQVASFHFRHLSLYL
jgi:hypothetical protein